MKTGCDNAFLKAPSAFRGRNIFRSTGLMQCYTVAFLVVACPGEAAALFQPESSSIASYQETSHSTENTTMWMTAGGHRFAITLEDNDTARKFAAMLPLSLNMAELNSNEKFAELDKQLPVNAIQPGLIENGDVMVYGNRTVVVFYKTFHSSYSYTRLGRINNPSVLAQVLGIGDVHMQFSAR